MILPPAPPAVGWVSRVRLGRDYYRPRRLQRLLVNPAAIGRFVDVNAALAQVEVRHEWSLTAAHERVWARGQRITDPAHMARAKVRREQFQPPRPGAEHTTI